MEKCPECGKTLEGGVCLNIDCSRAREAATVGAARETAKARGQHATLSEPRAFSSSGRVD